MGLHVTGEEDLRLEAQPFKTFPDEWKLVISGHQPGESELEPLVTEVADKVRNSSGRSLVHISHRDEAVLRDELYDLGFDDYYQKYIYLLDLTRFIPNQQQLPRGYELVRWNIYTEFLEEDRIQELFDDIYNLECQASDDIPNRTGFQHPSLEEFKTRFSSQEAKIDSLFVILYDHTIVGLTYAYIDNGTPGIFFTGVSADHRGQGLATALKSRLAMYLKRRGYQKLLTSNKSTNDSVLATNDKLGFRKIGTTYLLKYPLN